MTNESNKINELVDSEDDPTFEVEEREVDAVTAKRAATTTAPQLESEDRTFDVASLRRDHSNAAATEQLRSELMQRASKAERLEYDFEQLHSKWLGLQAELRTREELSTNLAEELRSVRRELRKSARTCAAQEELINNLKGRLQERDEEFRNLEKVLEQVRLAKAELESGDEVSAARARLMQYEGAMASLEATVSGLRNQQEQTEKYADDLRRQLADLRNESRSAVTEYSSLKVELGNAEKKIATLENKLVKAAQESDQARTALATAREEHEQEMRQLRFELGAAQETLAENTELNEQLASDLVQNRGYKMELERMLSDSEKRGQEKIESLEKQVAELEDAVADYEDKLESKSATINSLLEELAKHGEDAGVAEGAGTGEFLPESDCAQLAGRAAQADRLTRLLIGQIDKQELRFPLFKNRLTIGRTPQNDIYLNAQYISRRHAVVVTEGDVTRIIDWGSKNGVYVNGRRITEHFLKSGDKVRIGSIEFRYEELPKRDPA